MDEVDTVQQETNTGSISNNIARNRKAFHCRSGEDSTNYGNDTIWTDDICYDLHVNNVIIIDLGGHYRVQKVSLKKHGYQAVNLTIRVGLHLADQCSVMRGVSCMASYEYWPNGTAKDLACEGNQSKPGRYIVIENKVKQKSIFCVMSVEGIAASVTKRTAFFSNANPSSSSGFPSFYTKNTQSEIDCARSCLQEPICLNFRWTDPVCSLYGGVIPNLEFGIGVGKRLQDFNQTWQ
ncbi:uncharacterized protein LOC124255514 isoform X2 [Haliotis rubra]|uniref:uncharacterized protein LOC124255514 isoform X2 n=1 Tax=Haliotis rubra TaxID=36100 RepID=UPI001EE55079|nr:uncharacterized protein LOC124255514 isoform X2 [Haliotis rubra]